MTLMILIAKVSQGVFMVFFFLYFQFAKCMEVNFQRKNVFETLLNHHI